MGAEDSRTNLKVTASNGFVRPIGINGKKKKNKEYYENKSSKIVESEENLSKKEEEKKKNKSLGNKRIIRENGNDVDDEQANQFNIEDKRDLVKKKSKLSRNKKRKNNKTSEAEIGEVNKLSNELEDGFDEQNGAEAGAKRKSKARKKKRINEKIKKEEIPEVDKLYIEVEDGSNLRTDESKAEAIQSATQGQIESYEGQHNADIGTNFKTRKSKKARKIKKQDRILSRNDEGLLEKRGEAEEDEVYQISSGDEDCFRGMKKWIVEYHQSRPGVKILQQRIDDFITAHEAQEEQARKEREACAAEGGWTVVVHHRGRKKTTDSESGIVVGSVAQAAVMDKMAKKKNKEVGLDFYRFQKREAQRNEIMILQSKFEQDKKRIQELRAARKFRPY